MAVANSAGVEVYRKFFRWINHMIWHLRACDDRADGEKLYFFVIHGVYVMIHDIEMMNTIEFNCNELTDEKNIHIFVILDHLYGRKRRSSSRTSTDSGLPLALVGIHAFNF